MWVTNSGRWTAVGTPCSWTGRGDWWTPWQPSLDSPLGSQLTGFCWKTPAKLFARGEPYNNHWVKKNDFLAQWPLTHRRFWIRFTQSQPHSLVFLQQFKFPPRTQSNSPTRPLPPPHLTRSRPNIFRQILTLTIFFFFKSYKYDEFLFVLCYKKQENIKL